MNELRVFLHSGLDVVDSREVAQMVEKRHDNLIRDISGYIKIIEKNNAIRSEDVTKGNERNFAPSDFFIPSTYKDRKGQIRPPTDPGGPPGVAGVCRGPKASGTGHRDCPTILRRGTHT